ncbi:MAG: hypothetical protein ABEI78_01380 [Candidatus Nanohaloarchaea archaeon]
MNRYDSTGETPVELLPEDKRKKVIELAEEKKILEVDNKLLEGMDFLKR